MKNNELTSYLKQQKDSNMNSRDKDFVLSEIENAQLFFSQKEYQKSIDIYIRMIGAIEPSVVISAFNQSHHHYYLLTYLISLHKKGYANSLHTELLFNLFIQCQAIDELSLFIQDIQNAYFQKHQTHHKKTPSSSYSSSDRFIQNFDSDIAIDILQKNGMLNEAQLLIQASGDSMSAVNKLIKQKKFVDAATLIFDHFDEPIGFKMLKKYGKMILKEDANAGKIIEQAAILIWSTGKQYDDSEMIKLFWGLPMHCYRFLKSTIHQNPTVLFVNTLISLLIPNQKSTSESFFGN